MYREQWPLFPVSTPLPPLSVCDGAGRVASLRLRRCTMAHGGSGERAGDVAASSDLSGDNGGERPSATVLVLDLVDIDSVV